MHMVQMSILVDYGFNFSCLYSHTIHSSYVAIKTHALLKCEFYTLVKGSRNMHECNILLVKLACRILLFHSTWFLILLTKSMVPEWNWHLLYYWHSPWLKSTFVILLTHSIWFLGEIGISYTTDSPWLKWAFVILLTHRPWFWAPAPPPLHTNTPCFAGLVFKVSYDK